MLTGPSGTSALGSSIVVQAGEAISVGGQAVSGSVGSVTLESKVRCYGSKRHKHPRRRSRHRRCSCRRLRA